MEVLSDEITCDIKRSFGKQPDIHFLHVSPALLGHHHLAQHEKEDRKKAEKTVPMEVFAKAGRLRIRVSSNLDERRRLAARPGITGLWQCTRDRNALGFDKRFDLDLKYIDEWSFPLDLWILCKTLLIMWEGGGE
jgi:hypothetical protein